MSRKRFQQREEYGTTNNLAYSYEPDGCCDECAWFSPIEETDLGRCRYGGLKNRKTWCNELYYNEWTSNLRKRKV